MKKNRKTQNNKEDERNIILIKRYNRKKSKIKRKFKRIKKKVLYKRENIIEFREKEENLELFEQSPENEDSLEDINIAKEQELIELIERESENSIYSDGFFLNTSIGLPEKNDSKFALEFYSNEAEKKERKISFVEIKD